MNTTIDRDALAALLIEHPEEIRPQVRMTGLSESILIHMVATKLDEFQFAQWWDARHVGGNAIVGPDMRVWQSRRILTELTIERHERMGADHSGLAEMLFDIPGITTVYITPYELSIVKSAAFGWDEIAPRVTGIIAGLNAR